MNFDFDTASATPPILTIDQVAEDRANLWSCDWRPIAISNWNSTRRSAGKCPVARQWQATARQDPPLDAANRPVSGALNTGVLCDDLRAVDIDIDHPATAQKIRELADKHFGTAPERFRNNSPRVLRPYRAADGPQKKRSITGTKGKVEVLGFGQQFVALGIHHTGAVLEWTQPLTTTPLESLTAITEEQIDEFFTEATAIIGAPENKRHNKARKTPAFAEAKRRGGRKATLEQIAAWITEIPNTGLPNWDEWNRVGMALWDATFQIQKLGEGRTLFHEWSAKNSSYDGGTTSERWEHYSSSPPNIVGAHTLEYLACEARMSDHGSELNEEERLPLIRVTAGRLPSVVTRVERVLIAGNVEIFQRGRQLVKPAFVEALASRGGKTITAAIVQFSVPSMSDIFAQSVRFEAFNKKERNWVRCDPPEKAVKIFLDRFGSWNAPTLAGVITTPTMRPDGSILSAYGYDPATRLFHVTDKSIQLSPEVFTPTRAAAEVALKDLLQLISEFPFGRKGSDFSSNVSQAVALSAMIAPVVRGAIGVTPLTAVRAPVPASGKSYFVDVVAAIATGRRCPVVAAGSDEIETEKRLAGLLLAGVPIISIDNLNGELGGDLLCQASERPLIRLRPLGASTIIEIENTTTIFATGNQLRVRGDLVRRTLICDLDPSLERPELRRFKDKPVERVLANRGHYVSAALTIAGAYIAAGRPGLLPQLASFEDWSDIVRSALIWLGCADPVDSMITARNDDPELTELEALLTAWDETLGADQPYTAREMAEKSEDIVDAIILKQHAWPKLREALLQVAGARDDKVDTRRLGKYLMSVEGRIVSGLSIQRESRGAHGGVTLWNLKSHAT